MSAETEESIDIEAPLDRVWEVLLDTSSWWPGMKLEPMSGGVFEEIWTEGGVQKVLKGTVVGFIPKERVRLSWKEIEWSHATEVVVDIKPEGSLTRIRLQHTGWDRFPEPQRTELLTTHAEGWRHHLGQLKEAAER